jgi:hypothetical protein
VTFALGFDGPIAKNRALWELRKMEALLGPSSANYGDRILAYLRIQEEERASHQLPAVPATRGKLPPAVLADHMRKYPRSSGISGSDRVKILLQEYGVKITRTGLLKRIQALPV